MGGLLNATFGNAVEIVVMVLALASASTTNDSEEKASLLVVVQTSLIGSIFSNSLLVLGCSFVANGIYYPKSRFNTTLVFLLYFIFWFFWFFFAFFFSKCVCDIS